MANIITGVYVSLDGLEYTRLDLHKDESINMKLTQKDLQNLSKIFAPYSQGFTFPATPKNRAALGFFGDTDVIKINTESKFLAKFYINDILNQTGFLTLSNLSYKNRKPVDFTGSFATTMANLKDRIGDDLLSELTDTPALVKWNVSGVQDMVRSSKTLVIDGINVKYFVPLISINRVWGYDTSSDFETLDNIAFNPASDLDGNNLIKPEELRPCISYGSILDFIKKKYALNITSPLESREEYLDLRVWCNAEKISNNDFKILPIYNLFGSLRWINSKHERRIPDPKKYTITTNLINNSFNVHKRPEPFQNQNEYVEDGFNFRVRFNSVIITGDATTTPELVVQYLRKSDDAILASDIFELIDGNTSSPYFEADTLLDDTLFGASENLEFYIKIKFEQPTSWSNSSFRMFFKYYDGKAGFFNETRKATYLYESLANNNSSEVSTDDVDLFKSLPEVKVVDFLTSHFKAFNISVFDTSPNDENLFWLTPEDILSKGKVWSKAVLDYTPYLDAKKYNKERPNDFNFYNFKHADSEYFSNKKFAEVFGLEYGQTTYPETKPTKDLKEFKVETKFSIIPPVKVNGATNFETAYGFTDDPPEVTETGETRYTPNFEELTVFYTHGSTNIQALGILGMTTRQVSAFTFITEVGVFSLTSYQKVMPWNINGHSFGFSVLTNKNIDYTNSLFLKYYSAQTVRLLNPNVLSQKFDLNLPPNEIYLNESTTIQGLRDTPSGFRLQNDIIIGEVLFSIIDAIIDQTTGKTKLTLLNYQ